VILLMKADNGTDLIGLFYLRPRLLSTLGTSSRKAPPLSWPKLVQLTRPAIVGQLRLQRCVDRGKYFSVVNR
jgi:hypothetical protein